MAHREFFSVARLNLANASGIRALRAVANGERNLVSLSKFVKRDVLKFVRVKEKILGTFWCPINFYEAEALFVLLNYCAVLHTADR